MEKTKYKNLVNKNIPKEDVVINAIIAFITTSSLGIFLLTK